MLDVAITGGTIVDGTGAPARRGDLGIRGGRIAAIGSVSEAARQTIDARGKVVAPGFVDVHTHYDAQVFWDATLSPSPFHGVTSIVGGNCGFSIAPLSDSAGDYLMRMLARVEGMPLESLRVGVPWDWRSFGEYLDRLERRIAVNAGFMVGHCALRRVAMGERAVGHEATPAELDAMRALLAASLREGGLGFSSTISPTHNDGEGQPVPSRHASRAELIALAHVVRDFPGTTLEFLPGVSVFGDEQKALMTELSLAANRPLNWNVLSPSADNRDYVEAQLSATDYARARGAEVIALTVPQAMTIRINLLSGQGCSSCRSRIGCASCASRASASSSTRGRTPRALACCARSRVGRTCAWSRRLRSGTGGWPARRSARSQRRRARRRSTRCWTSRSRTS
jgi:N-acyl-D-aspartate/D-glutamate deacylase